MTRASLRFGLSLVAFGLMGCPEDTVTRQLGKLEAQALVDFMDVQVGITQTLDFNIKNAGEGRLKVEQVERSGEFTAEGYEFAMQLPAEGFILEPSQTKVVPISFTPFVAMEDPVEVRFTMVTDIEQDGAKQRFTVTLRGRGERSGLVVIPQPVDFGKVLIGSSHSLTVKIRNELGSPVEVTTKVGSDGRAIITNQGGVGRFEVVSPVQPSGALLPPNSDGTPGKLAPAGEMEVELRYTPDPGQEGRPETAVWKVANCANPLCELNVQLKGVGTNAAIECDPAALEFGQVNPGSVVSKRTQCSNVATEKVRVTGWEMAPGTPAEFSVVAYNGIPSDLEPGSTFNVEVRFSPVVTNVGNLLSGTLRINGRNLRANRDLTPGTVAVSGVSGGPDIDVTPGMINFGQVAIGTKINRRILITNVGYSTLNVTGVEGDAAQTGTFSTDVDGSQFAVNAATPQGMPAETRIVVATFEPLTPGVINSEIVIRSDDVDEPEVRIPVQGNGVMLPPCIYTLTPTNVNFGIVQVLRSTTQGVRIQNTGPNDCLINDIAVLAGSSMAFSLVTGNETGVILTPGATKTIVLGYTPALAGVDSGKLGFYISDPSNPNIEVDLRGVGSESALLITPNEVDFGRIGYNPQTMMGCSTRERAINIFNTGANATTVVRIERGPGVTGEFEVVTLPAGVPMPPGAGARIQPGQSVEFTVRYHAMNLGTDTGFIHIFEAGRTDPYVVPLYGEGAVDPTNEDRYEQLETPEVDILWAIDNSCSMSDKQQALAANFSSFAQFANAQALDYRMAVITTDVDGFGGGSGCPSPLTAQRPAVAFPPNFNGVGMGACGYFADGNYNGTLMDPAWRIITPNTQPSPEAAFAALVNQDISGSGFEQGLQAAYQALSSPLITGWNAGFLRPTAYLALIFVSDADDQASSTVDFFVNYFLAIKGFRNTQLFSASAISQNPDDSCGEGYGPRYQEVANRTGGIYESICTTDWAQALQNLGLSVFGYKSRFFLSNQPVAGTVEVLVNGVKIDPTAPSGQVRWSYDQATNTVNFAPLAIPEPGSEIIIRYTAECL